MSFCGSELTSLLRVEYSRTDSPRVGKRVDLNTEVDMSCTTVNGEVSVHKFHCLIHFPTAALL
jgi:hypothetical protein